MGKYIRAFGVITILCFSFYCAEQTALFMQKKDPLYETILAVKDDYVVEAVDAIVFDNYIIPGVAGIEINVRESFKNMKYIGAFQTNSLVFEEVRPSISVTNFNDKIIKSGNSMKQGVSFLLSDESLILYFEEMGIPYAVLTTKENLEKNRAYGEKINYDYSNYKEVDNYLNKLKENHNLCYVKDNFDFCSSKKKIMFEETRIIQKSNYVKEITLIQSGDIIYIQNGFELANLKLLLEQVRFKGLTVYPLSELLSESR